MSDFGTFRVPDPDEEKGEEDDSFSLSVVIGIIVVLALGIGWRLWPVKMDLQEYMARKDAGKTAGYFRISGTIVGFGGGQESGFQVKESGKYGDSYRSIVLTDGKVKSSVWVDKEDIRRLDAGDLVEIWGEIEETDNYILGMGNYIKKLVPVVRPKMITVENQTLGADEPEEDDTEEEQFDSSDEEKSDAGDTEETW